MYFFGKLAKQEIIYNILLKSNLPICQIFTTFKLIIYFYIFYKKE